MVGVGYRLKDDTTSRAGAYSLSSLFVWVYSVHVCTCMLLHACLSVCMCKVCVCMCVNVCVQCASV